MIEESRDGKAVKIREGYFRLVLDPADRSENAEHLRDEELEIRILPGSVSGPAAIVLSPKFRAKEENLGGK